MKKILNYTLFVFFCFMFIVLIPKADDNCNYKDQQALNKEASNIKTSYEFIDEDPLNYHFKINITNIAEDLRLYITDDYSIKELEITYSNTDNGVYTFETLIATRKVTFTMDIYVLSGPCAGKKLQTKRIVTPRYNSYSTSYICEQVPEFEYCGQFVDTSSMTYSQFLQKGEKYKNEAYQQPRSDNNKSWIKYIWKFIINKWIYLTVGFGILLFGVVATLIVRKKHIEARGV